MAKDEPAAEGRVVPNEALDLQALCVPKHKRLQIQLERRIRNGEFSPSRKLPTEKELMRQSRLSYATVSRALRALAAAGLVKRKRGCGTFVTGAVGRIRSSESTDPSAATIAHFHGGIKPAFHPYYSLLVQGFVGAATAHGMAMKFVAAPGGVLGVSEGFLKRHGIAGFTASQPKRSELEAALALQIPMVDLSGYYRDLAADRVESDGGLGRRLALSHLRDLGHERIAVVDSQRRADVREDAAEVFDCLPEEAPIATIAVEGWTIEVARSAVASLQALDPRPRAALVGDDMLLMNLLRALAEAGIRVPQDLAIVGRGTPASAQFLGAPVTMIEFDPVAIAKAAVDLLVRRVREGGAAGEVVRIEPKLVVRESCGAGRRG